MCRKSHIYSGISFYFYLTLDINSTDTWSKTPLFCFSCSSQNFRRLQTANARRLGLAAPPGPIQQSEQLTVFRFAVHGVRLPTVPPELRFRPVPPVRGHPTAAAAAADTRHPNGGSARAQVFRGRRGVQLAAAQRWRRRRRQRWRFCFRSPHAPSPAAAVTVPAASPAAAAAAATAAAAAAAGLATGRWAAATATAADG